MSASPRRRPGRPPLDWLSWEGVLEVEPGTALHVDAPGLHEMRVVGRVRLATRRRLTLRMRDGEDKVVTVDKFRRAREVAGLFKPGDPVLRRGVSFGDWRGGVIRSDGDRVLCELPDGSTEWRDEAELEHADDRAAAELAERMAPLKPGPVAADPTTELLNQRAYAAAHGSEGE